MKRLILVVAMAMATVAMADAKVGVVDMLKLVRNHKSYDSNKTLLQNTEKDYKAKLDGIRSELERQQAEGRKLVEESRNPMISAEAKAKLEREIGEIQQKLMAGQQRLSSEALHAQQDLTSLEQRMLRTAGEEIREIVNAYAKDKGFDFIFTSEVTVFAKKGADVTDEVLKAMGVDPKTAKGKDEGK